ncbi:hypothetical protein HanRHA438_Chr08g0356811 [Helianthus annuus]|nr:hypothetical protein HanHA89_Chr14g0564081 [Helianthus annuus]KAJ0655626.1 hypothetical protein HanLR1_Chr14g0526421 [Helianthus annuus]KAJ0659313.1 hypothetical protein HanOQP8_Chr14g0524661 [Helianthus annuus]KAJ0852944.1 hypothetical protein HanRHA438_Chr14g0645511 [Helianthus annuus]KAJ0898440.1 hypothetical protein HanRHA438_Chr08g0356811 [Helianthus annuus]
MRVDFTNFLNQRFSLTHSTLMGPTEIPSQYAEIIKFRLHTMLLVLTLCIQS